MEDLKMHIVIKTENEEEKMRIGNSIHEQLVGNKDYRKSNIVLNIDEVNEINLYVFKECKYIPVIAIK